MFKLNNRSMLFLLPVLLVSTNSGFAHAEGHGPGNGGNAVVIAGKPYLLDLVEAGVQARPYFKNIEEIKSCVDDACTRRELREEHRRFLARTEYGMYGKGFDSETLRMFNEKLLSMHALDRELIALGMKMYQWRITDLPLEEVKDIQSPLDLSHATVYQLAYRRDDAILINREIWNQLDTANRVALIFHEVIYAMLRPLANGDGTFTQESWDARLIVGNLFTQDSGSRDLVMYTRNGIPMLGVFEAKEPRLMNYVFGEYGGMPNILMAYTRNDGAEILYNPGISVNPTNASEKSIRTYLRSENAWELNGKVDPHFEYSNACGELEAYGFRGEIRAFYVNAFLRFVDYKTSAGYTKAISAKYSLKQSGSYGGVDENGDVIVVNPQKKEVAYTSAKECSEKLPSDASEVAATFDRTYDGLPNR